MASGNSIMDEEEAAPRTRGLPETPPHTESSRQHLRSISRDATSAPDTPGVKTVHVVQGEFAAVDRTLVDFVGTDEMTTCIGVAMFDPQIQRAVVGHLDSAEGAKESIEDMLHSLCQGSCTKVQVHLVGAYNDTAAHRLLPETTSKREADQARERKAALSVKGSMADRDTEPLPYEEKTSAGREHRKGQAGGKRSTREEKVGEGLGATAERTNPSKGENIAEGSTQLVGRHTQGSTERWTLISSQFLCNSEEQSNASSTSWCLIQATLQALKASAVPTEVCTACLWDDNTTVSGLGHSIPRTRAFWLDTWTGACHFTDAFTEQQRQPDPNLRYAVVCAVRRNRRNTRLVTFYDTSRDLYTLPAVRLASPLSSSYWMSALRLNDGHILAKHSTSPQAESSLFVPSMRSLFKLYAEESTGRSVFEGTKSISFVRGKSGAWTKETDE